MKKKCKHCKEKGIAVLSALVALTILTGLLAGVAAPQIVPGQVRGIFETLNIFFSLLAVTIVTEELRWIGLVILTPMLVSLAYIITRLIRGGG